MDTIHVLVGIPIQLIFAVILRVSVKDIRPVLAVFMFVIANEWLDWRSVADPDLEWRWNEGV